MHILIGSPTRWMDNKIQGLKRDIESQVNKCPDRLSHLTQLWMLQKKIRCVINVLLKIKRNTISPYGFQLDYASIAKNKVSPFQGDMYS